MSYLQITTSKTKTFSKFARVSQSRKKLEEADEETT